MFSSERCHPIREGAFCALALTLRQVAWLDMFKSGPNDKYDNFSNPEEFI
jgi:hypothetical protein